MPSEGPFLVDYLFLKDNWTVVKEVAEVAESAESEEVQSATEGRLGEHPAEKPGNCFLQQQKASVVTFL